MDTAPRIYVDTSVFGGAFDDEFRTASRLLFDLVMEGKFRLCTSGLVKQEIAGSPSRVQSLFADLEPIASILPPDSPVLDLQQRYVEEGVLGAASQNDALHVAYASVARCSFITSWNFRHIVNFRRIPLFNAVNVLAGYNAIGICTPYELVGSAEGNSDDS